MVAVVRHLIMSAACLRPIIFAALLSVVPVLASAQPQSGEKAAGVDFGVSVPKDPQLGVGLIADGFFEFYPSARVGIRPIFTGIRHKYSAHGDDDDERQVRLGVDVIYNWPRGAVLPFVGAGVGVHHVRFCHHLPHATKFGGNVLGGAEFFVNRAWTVKAEGRYQWVANRPDLDPDGLGLLVGVKRYF